MGVFGRGRRVGPSSSHPILVPATPPGLPLPSALTSQALALSIHHQTLSPDTLNDQTQPPSTLGRVHNSGSDSRMKHQMEVFISDHF